MTFARAMGFSLVMKKVSDGEDSFDNLCYRGTGGAEE